jgi:hypothetical protein
MSDENMELLLERLSAKIQELKIELKEEVKADINELKIELKQEVKADINELDKRWNERFFQPSKETLGFARNVIVTAAVVVVLVPFAKEALILVPKLLEL